VTSSAYRIAQFLLFVSPLLWTVNYLVARWAPGIIAPHALALGRWTLALFIMWLALGRERAQLFTVFRTNPREFIIMGALGMWICGAFVYIGGRSTQAINISLIYAASPIGVAIISHWMYHEKLSWLQTLGITLALAGMLAIVGKGDLKNLTQLQFNPGDWWIVAASCAWSVYSLMMRHKPSTLSGGMRLSAITLGGILVLTPFAAIEYIFFPQWSEPVVAQAPVTLPLLKAAGLIVAAAVFPGYLAYRAFSHVTEHLGSTRASIMLYLGPVYVALVGWLVLDEVLRAYHAWGGGLVLLGVYMVSRPTKASV
jgi:drug/metabolite transporter (DMT)-like permease